jgi:cell wall-associated NlpC family hydrolase
MVMEKIGIINVSISNHYRDPSSQSEIVTQGCLGERVAILEEQENHTLIRQADNYQSWIPEDQLVSGVAAVTGEKVTVLSHFVRIYSQPAGSSPAIRDAVIGSHLTTCGETGEWYKIVLPDGIVGWAEKKHFGAIPELSAKNIISLASDFLGYPYFWGGISPRGFDCSGFVQTVFKLHGIQLPRDAWQQQQNNLVSTNHLDAQPGDVLFFSRTPEKVTHVAIALGNQRYIHASGWVRIDSFDESDPLFTRQRAATFTSVNRYLPSRK